MCRNLKLIAEKNLFVYIIFLLFEDNNTLSEQLNGIEGLYEQNEYNLDLRDFTLAVGNAMNKSAEFRKLIKKRGSFQI